MNGKNVVLKTGVNVQKRGVSKGQCPLPGCQCDQMVRLYFNIWTFATMKTSPIMSQICQSRLNILPNKT